MTKKKEKITPVSKVEEGLVLPIDYDPKNYKSMFYLLNGKPDTDVKVLPKRKKVCIEDINNLNEKILEKLETYKVVINIVSVDVIFINKRAKSFNDWQEFLDMELNTPLKVKTINITWDFAIRLPKYRVPQRHTVKLRLGVKPKASEMFHIILEDEGDLELDEYFSSAVCKVDFINPLISEEIINIVSTWYDSLPTIDRRSKIEKFMNSYSVHIADFVSYMFPIITLVLIYSVINNFINISFIDMNATLLLREITLGVTISLSILILSLFIGQVFAKNKVLPKLEKFQGYTMFEITKGDKNRNKEVGEKNSKLVKELLFQFIIISISTLLAYTVPILIRILVINSK